MLVSARAGSANGLWGVGGGNRTLRRECWVSKT